MDITQITELLTELAVTVLAAVILPVLVKKYGAEKTSRLAYWTSAAVRAAEQIYADFTKAGEKKKNYVISVLGKLGLMYDEEAVNALIESEVQKLNASENRV